MTSALPPPPPPTSPPPAPPPSPGGSATTTTAKPGWWDVRRWSTQKRWIVGLAVVAIIGTGALGGRDAGAERRPDAVAPQTSTTEVVHATTTVAPTTTAAPTTEAPATTSQPTTTASPPTTVVPSVPRGTPAEVLEVVDGDTVKVDLGGIKTSVRIIGIDTPETVHPSKPVQCFGPEASRRARELLDGQTVGVEYDGTQGRLDKYGRVLAFLWLPDGRLYTTVMLQEGLAKEYTYSSGYKHRSEHLAAEQDARANGRGLWAASTCDGDTDQTDPSSAKAPSAPPAPKPAPAPPAPAPSTGGDVYYANCTAARNAGVAPIHRGEPGYRSALDRDDDGVACE